MKALIVGAILLTGCTVTRPAPLTPSVAQANVLELAIAVQIAAVMCSSNAKHLAHIDRARGDALFSECVSALIPARDSVSFSETDPGCVGASVRLGLERVQAAFIRFGYAGPVPGIDSAKRLERHALPSCDPLHPTTTVTTYIDPNIARITPEYP